jgi:hypothetical protein
MPAMLKEHRLGTRDTICRPLAIGVVDHCVIPSVDDQRRALETLQCEIT